MLFTFPIKNLFSSINLTPKNIDALSIKESKNEIISTFYEVKNIPNKYLSLFLFFLIMITCYLNIKKHFFLKKINKKKELFNYQEPLINKLVKKEKEKEKEKEKAEKLKQKLDFKNKQITSYAFSYEQKNQIINQIFFLARSLEKTSSTFDQKDIVKEIVKIGKKNISIDKEWEHFREFFEESLEGFHFKLKQKHKELKTNDLKICSLIRLNLNIKEMANILNVSPGSLKTARYRLRKKLNLEPGQKIIDYLIGIEKTV